ncbi:MAG: response regulator [Deltaproteobacteria bacterium]|nr:response regulator [Deltaproteobacteria bacterium]
MAVITVFGATHCRSEEVVRGVAERLGVKVVDNAVLLAHAARRFQLSAERLDRAMHGTRSVFNRLTREKERGIAYLQFGLAELVQPDGVAYHGFASHLLPRSLTHVLRVCLVAKLEHRAATAAAALGVTVREAEKLLARDDEAAAQWTLHLSGLGPWSAGQYDIVLPMDATPVERAVELIAENAAKPALRTTPLARKAMDDFLLSCRVNVTLVDEGHDVDVTADGDAVLLTINRYVMRLEHHERELVRIASRVPGVKSVTTKVGPHFSQPNIYPKADFLPTKILLVDDEKEFVETLSERLQTRNIESAIAYDGEQALAIFQDDAPEVMVLDLKMPGIDGLEVLRRVKRDHPATEVIILTGHGSPAEAELAKELGAFAYLEKPVDVDVLADTMKAAYRKIGEAK